MQAFKFLFKLVVLTSFCLPLAVHAEELRIETDVFSANSDEAISHTTTLFDSGTVYDFSEEKQQVAVFRLPTATHPGEFTLLDLKNKRRTEVTTDKIEKLISKLSKWAKSQEDPLLKFSAEPDFAEEFEAETGKLTLDSLHWNYTVVTVPAENVKTLGQYRQFIDWYTRLNVMMHGTPPPGPRLALNAALEKHAVMPVEITRELKAQSATLRATHLFSWRLSREDRAKVEEVRKQLASFEKVDNKNFIAELTATSKHVVRGQSK